jgi:hypothetical protein
MVKKPRKKKKIVPSKLSIISWTITSAIICGLYLFSAPLFDMWRINFGGYSHPIFVLLYSAYPGLTPNWLGAFVGLAYGLVSGAILGFLFTVIHNWILKLFK